MTLVFGGSCWGGLVFILHGLVFLGVLGVPLCHVAWGYNLSNDHMVKAVCCTTTARGVSHHVCYMAGLWNINRCPPICGRPGLCSQPTCSAKCCGTYRWIWQKVWRTASETSQWQPLQWREYANVTPGVDLTPDAHCVRRARAGAVTGADSPPRLDAAMRLTDSMSVAFGFIVRDGGIYLEPNTLRLLALGERYFRTSRLFYVENDSSDDTREVLRRLQRREPGRIEGVMLDNASQVHSLALCPPTIRAMNCARRLVLLASLRQRLIAMALDWHGWDVLVQVDIDFVDFVESDFVSMVALGHTLNASAIFGTSVKVNGSRTWNGGQNFYDTGAVVPQDALNAMMDRCLTRVRSAFSGFGVYYASPLRSVRPPPGYKPSHLARSRAQTEHETFHASLRRAGPLLVDPRFRPHYQYWFEAENAKWRARALAVAREREIAKETLRDVASQDPHPHRRASA